MYSLVAFSNRHCYPKKPPAIYMDNYYSISDTLVEEFGHGKTSKVVKVEDRKDGRFYAMKIIIANSQHRYDTKDS